MNVELPVVRGMGLSGLQTGPWEGFPDREPSAGKAGDPRLFSMSGPFTVGRGAGDAATRRSARQPGGSVLPRGRAGHRAQGSSALRSALDGDGTDGGDRTASSGRTVAKRVHRGVLAGSPRPARRAGMDHPLGGCQSAHWFCPVDGLPRSIDSLEGAWSRGGEVPRLRHRRGRTALGGVGSCRRYELARRVATAELDYIPAGMIQLASRQRSHRCPPVVICCAAAAALRRLPIRLDHLPTNARASAFTRPGPFRPASSSRTADAAGT